MSDDVVLLTYPCGLKVHVGLTYEEFCMTSMRSRVRKFYGDAQAASFGLPAAIIGGRDYLVTLRFYEHKLERILLCFRSGGRWENWTQEKEDIVHADDHAWVLKQFGKPSVAYFSWGSVHASISPQDGTSGVAILLKTEHMLRRFPHFFEPSDPLQD